MAKALVNFWMCTSSEKEAQKAIKSLSFVKVNEKGEVRVPADIQINSMIVNLQNLINKQGAILILGGVMPIENVSEIDALRRKFEDKKLKGNPQVKKYIIDRSTEMQNKLENIFKK